MAYNDARMLPIKVRQNENKKLLEECLKNCSIYCETWTFESSKTVITTEKLTPNTVRLIQFAGCTIEFLEINIKYPDFGQILVVIEMDSQTWEFFVSNVGGLLGIWTGASVLSFIQLIYLCCCAAVNEA